MTNIAIIFAGGIGSRCKTGNNIPKQFYEINKKPVIIHTLKIFDKHPEIDKIYVSVLKKYRDLLQDYIKKFNIKKVQGIIYGGDTGQESIYNALCLASKENSPNSTVLIHDAVRPFLDPHVISKNIESVKKYGNAITCNKFNETLAICKNREIIDNLIDRDSAFIARAPQSFYLGEILDAHKKIIQKNMSYKGIVDSCSLYKYLNMETFMVLGNEENIKITTSVDLSIAPELIKRMKNYDY